MFEFGASDNEPEYERPTWRCRSVYRNLDNFWFADNRPQSNLQITWSRPREAGYLRRNAVVGWMLKIRAGISEVRRATVASNNGARIIVAGSLAKGIAPATHDGRIASQAGLPGGSMQLRLWIALAIAMGGIAAPGSTFGASLKVLHTFNGPPDGATAQGDLIFDGAGNLYGTTTRGGLYDSGTVFELSPDGSGNWAETILYNFQGAADGEAPIAGLVMDAQGNLYGTTQIGGIQNGYCVSGCGVAFELSIGSSGWNYRVIYSFTSVPDGAFPSGDLVFDSAGNLYGLTSGGGSEGVCIGVFPGCGTAFELVKANGWQDQILHRFNYSLTDGSYPSGKLLLDRQGNLYGTTESGGAGAHGLYHGTVFEMKPSNGAWTERLIYDFCQKVNCDDGSGPSAGVIEIDGQLYGTVPTGGANNYGGVFRVQKSGASVVESSHLFKAAADGVDAIAPLLYREGSLYGVGEQGGIQNGACPLFQTGNGVVFQLSIVNEIPEETVLYEFTGGADGCGPVGGLVADTAGNLYGTTSQGSTNGGAVFEVTP